MMKGGSSRSEELAQLKVPLKDGSKHGGQDKQPNLSSYSEFTPTGVQKLLSVLYYMGASILVQSANKALFTVWGFKFPLLIAFMQMAIIAPVTFLIARPSLNMSTAITVLPLALVNVCNVVAGLVGTAGLTVPMFIALRRFTFVTTIIAEYVMYKRVQESKTYAWIAIIISGSLIAAFNDLSFNFEGYMAMLLNNTFTSIYFVLMKYIKTDLTSTGMMFYNSALSLLPMLALLFSSSQGFEWMYYPQLNDPGFWAIFAASCCLGLTINHGTFLCTRYNDPLTTSIAGSFKNIFMTFFGAVAFGDFEYHPWNVAGLAISLVGSCIYAYDKVTSQLSSRNSSKSSDASPSEPKDNKKDFPVIQKGKGGSEV